MDFDPGERLVDALAPRPHAADVAAATLRAAQSERIAQILVPFVRGRSLTGRIA